MGTYAVLEAVRTSARAPALVFASSGAYYGTTTQHDPVNEDQPPLVAANIYAPSKVAGDVAVRCYARTYGIKAAVCRFINTYGPGNTNFSTIVPRTISHLITGRPYDFGDRDDGSSTFDYLHIRDMTHGYILVAENIERVYGEAFNLGGERCISVRELVKLISRLYDGREREPVFHGAKVSFTSNQLDICKLRAELDGSGFVVSLRDSLDGGKCIRVAPHFYNTEEELSLFLSRLPDSLRRS